MIKKRYVAIFIALAIIVICSSIYTYHKNYVFQLNNSIEALEKLSESAKAQYDATFFQICGTVEDALAQIKNTDEREQIQIILKEGANQSYFIEDMILLYDDGYSIQANNTVSISTEKAMPYFANQNEALCTGLIESTNDKDVFYVVNYLRLTSDKSALLLVGLNYKNLNAVTRPEMYSAHNSYIYLVSRDGYLLYHPDIDIIARNIVDDGTDLQIISQMNAQNYSKLIDIIKMPPELVQNYFFEYQAFDINKIGYASSLDSFNGVLFIAANYDIIKEQHLNATLRTLLPLAACFLLGMYTLLRYIFLIKYTDYFTEVKNDLAFRNRLHRNSASNFVDEHYLILKIENVIHSKDKGFLYDDSVFYKISNYFKLLSPYYIDIYRISRVHYVFVLKKKTSTKVITSLINELKRNIYNEANGELYIRGKILFLTLDNISNIANLDDVDNKILSDMDNYYKNLSLTPNIDFVNYSDVLSDLAESEQEKTLIESIIRNKQVIPYYQPIVDLRTGEILKHEVLLRFTDNIYPKSIVDFIKSSESEGLIDKIDKTIIRQAFKMYHQRLVTEGKRTPLSINISSKSICYEMKYFICENAKICNVIPSDITFELTETSNVENQDDIFTILKLLRLEGYKIAIDDFGTGYSHVALLSKLEVDYLKIDGIFIKDIHKDEQKIKTLHALVYLGKNYDVKIIAEYMENIESIEILKKMGVEYGQGHYFGEAKPHI